MAIVSTDIKFWLTGKAAEVIDYPQPDPNASLGEGRSSTEMVTGQLNNLFDDISGAEAESGDTEYRGIIIQNKHASLTLYNAKAFLSVQPNGSRTTRENISIATEAVMAENAISTIATENDAPSGAGAFSAPATYATGLALGDLGVDGQMGLWIKRVVPASTEASASANFTLVVQGDTQA